jgi:hypothetical protein
MMALVEITNQKLIFYNLPYLSSLAKVRPIPPLNKKANAPTINSLKNNNITNPKY